MAFSSNGQRASGSSDRTIKIWDITISADSTFLRKHDGPIVSVAISDDNAYIASACQHMAKV